MPYRPYRKSGFGGGFRRRNTAAVANRAARQGAFQALRQVAPRMAWPRAPLATRGFYGPQRRSPQERKLVDTVVTGSVMDVVGNVTLINGVATGTDFTNRIGRKINVKSILVRALARPQDGVTVARFVRMMVVLDTQPNSALAGITDILTTSTALSPLNLNNRDRFRVLIDKQQWHGGGDTTAGQAFSDHNSGIFHKYKRCNFDTIFDGTDATIASIQSGALLFVTIGSAAAGDSSTLDFYTRVRFVDA